MRSLLAVPKALPVPVLNGVRPGPGWPGIYHRSTELRTFWLEVSL